MERQNAEGVPRHQLLLFLRDPKAVLTARRIDACLICRNKRVSDAGLCHACLCLLEGEELRVATRWLTGVEP